MREDVPLKLAYRLLNHGPTVLVSAAHEGRRNAMAAAWAMPLDFAPPKVAIVIDRSTFTRGLVEASGRFAISVPCRATADLTYTLGSHSGNDEDKFERRGVPWFAGSTCDAPLIEGCVAWLECRVIPWPEQQAAHDLFLGEVLSAQADTRVFRGGRWHFDGADPELRTVHHVAGGAFLSPSDPLQAKALA